MSTTLDDHPAIETTSFSVTLPPQDEPHSVSGSPSPPAAPPALSRRARWARRLVSAWLLYHVVGIIIAPAAVSPSSALLQSSWRWFRPYLQFFYLNHGYHFFAPEPGASTLVGYTLEFPDGARETGRFPNPGISPRLLYHRHFMLSEFLGFVPDDQEQPWHRSYARHLCRTYGAERVSLSRITHDLPTPRAILEGKSLTDPEGYTEVPLGSFSCDEL